MSDSFKALVLNQEGENFNREIKSIDKTFLKHGDVLVKVEYSGLNFKDALILKNGARLVKEFPHIPGIDFSGKVEESQNNKFKPGDEIILTGWRVGEIFYGGYSQYAKVNGDFLVKKTKTLTSKQAMVLGTAGLTALQCAFAVKAREDLLLGDKVENVLVTGASGGVGSIAVMVLNKLGYNVTAVSSKKDNNDYLKSLGAKSIINTISSIQEGISELSETTDSTETLVYQLRNDIRLLAENITILKDTIDSAILPNLDENVVDLVIATLAAFTVCVVACLMAICYTNHLEMKTASRRINIRQNSKSNP